MRPVEEDTLRGPDVAAASFVGRLADSDERRGEPGPAGPRVVAHEERERDDDGQGAADEEQKKKPHERARLRRHRRYPGAPRSNSTPRRELEAYTDTRVRLGLHVASAGFISVPGRGDNRGMRRTVVVALVAGAALGGFLAIDEIRETEQGGSATVVDVTDGDTIKVRLQGDVENVRLIGIDTPETHGRGGLRECFGREATSRTAALLPPGTPVRLERDVEPRDRYGRLLAYVFRVDDGLFVNLTLAREGYAAQLTIPPNVTYAEEFREAVAKARGSARGLWRRCGNADTPLR